jgi:hypothetical protein
MKSSVGRDWLKRIILSPALQERASSCRKTCSDLHECGLVFKLTSDAKRIKAEKNLRAVLQDLEERMTEYDDGFWGI